MVITLIRAHQNTQIAFLDPNIQVGLLSGVLEEALWQEEAVACRNTERAHLNPNNLMVRFRVGRDKIQEYK